MTNTNNQPIRIYTLLSLIILLFCASVSFAQVKQEALKGDSVAVVSNNMIDRNFIINPDAENKVATTTVPGWENITADSHGNALITSGIYGSALGDNSNGAVLKSGFGSYYFTSTLGGENKEASGFQTIDLSPMADDIDAGKISYNMSGAFGGVRDAFAQLSVKFLSGPGIDIGTFYTNNLTPEEVNTDSLVLLNRVKAGDVPKGSRKMVIQLKFYNLGSDDTPSPAFADNLSVILLRKP